MDEAGRGTTEPPLTSDDDSGDGVVATGAGGVNGADGETEPTTVPGVGDLLGDAAATLGEIGSRLRLSDKLDSGRQAVRQATSFLPNRLGKKGGAPEPTSTVAETDADQATASDIAGSGELADTRDSEPVSVGAGSVAAGTGAATTMTGATVAGAAAAAGVGSRAGRGRGSGRNLWRESRAQASSDQPSRESSRSSAARTTWLGTATQTPSPSPAAMGQSPLGAPAPGPAGGPAAGHPRGGGPAFTASASRAGYTGPEAPAWQNRASSAPRQAQARRGPRRQAHLTLARVEPWSVMKFSFVASVVAFIILFIAITVIYLFLAGLGVFSSLEHTVSTITSSEGTAGTNIAGWFSASRILGYTGMLGALNIVLITALSTIGAVIYNVIAHVFGGVEVTLREAD